MAIRTPAPGVVVDGKYRLAERLGGGGMGDVYRAENILAGRSVAIKFLHQELVDNPEIAQRFFQEAQAVNRIRHPNIVDVIDAGIGDAGPYMVMEYLEGESVASALARVGRFEIDAAIGAAIPVLEALDAAHRVGIIHRDLKPENVFIAQDASRSSPVVRLLDFGIAKVLETSGDASPRTRTGIVYGTPDYLSPEQATGEMPLDGRSDLFAVGVLLYELLTGTRPFRAPTPVATAFRVVHAEAPTLAAAGVHAEARLEAVVERLLRKEPARRFPTASDVVRELDRILPDVQRRTTALSRLAAGSRLGSGSPPSERSRSGGYRRSGEGSPPSEPPGVSRSGGIPIGSTAQRLGSGRMSAVPPRGSDASVPPRSESDASGRIGAAKDAHRVASIRPFPERFAGLHRVRGPVLRSIDRAIIDAYGRAGRDEVVAQMPEHHSVDYVNDSINALVAYELEALDAYMELATVLVLRDVEKWRELGRMAVGGELQGVVRTVLRPSSDLSVVVRRGVSVWARLFDFGRWRVTSSGRGKVALHIGDFEPASLPLRLWVVGVVEETARRATGDSEVKAAVMFGEMSFAPELACEIG